MRVVFVFLATACCLSASPRLVTAASVDVTGAAGLPGTDVVGPPQPGIGLPGGAGGDGGDANAISDSTDADNSASATGGDGGRGGNGGASVYPTDPNLPLLSFGGRGGAGGSGGTATSLAQASASSGPATAAAVSTGGVGGAGGDGGSGEDAGGSGGAGGDGGDAQAQASASAELDASASAESRAGGGGNGGVPWEKYPGSYYEPRPRGAAGRAGDAQSSADAHSALGAADASARAFGAAPGAGVLAYLDPTSLDGGSANADAFAEGADTASATSLAVGGRAGAWYSNGYQRGTPGTAHATARAVSESGNAIAMAVQIAGEGAPGFAGPLVSGPYIEGGVGGSTEMVDAVSGSAPGRLTLSQEAFAGVGGAGAPGGSATSVLHASNPRGELVAHSIAWGARGRAIGYLGTSYGAGGDASAEVEATDTLGAYVEANALAGAGEGGGSYQYYGQRSQGGNATSHATASGLGLVSASAQSQTLNGNLLTSGSDALSPFAFSAARSSATLTPRSGFAATDFGWASATQATIGVANPAGALLPATGRGEARLFAAPQADVAATWLEGNANSLAVGLPVLALGAVGSSAHAGDDVRLAGQLSLDLATRYFDESAHLSLAFLDPVALGAGFDALNLSFSREGQVVFQRSFTDSASALADLDDAVIDLGGFLASDGELLSLVLDYELVLDDAADTGFAFDLALLGTAPSPVPEPAFAPLALAALVALSAARRTRARTP